MTRTMHSLLIVSGLAVTTSMNASMAVAQRSSAEEIMEKFAEAVGDPAGAGGVPTRTSKGYYHVAFKNNYLTIASGLGGLQIIEIVVDGDDEGEACGDDVVNCN